MLTVFITNMNIDTQGALPLVIEKVFQYGLLGALFVGLLIAVGYVVWKIGLKVSDQTIKTLTSISETNEKFAESSSKTADLIKILADQTESTLEQLKYIKSHLKKQDYAAMELMNVIKILPKYFDNDKDVSEIQIRIDNVIKELQRND